MPPAARAAVTRHAQGIPLFAVETVRALIDRDIVQPSGGVYRLVGDIGELAVPDSLHALLAARLDALDPDVRRLVADAAVLGTTFPAEALVAVSGLDEQAVRVGLEELLRREVLSVSADPLSPERGSYQFAQQMLQQVAYDTLSRRDRKARHLAVAEHLRTAFPGDGEEVADVIARHYLDALNAVPEDPDAGHIRDQVIGELIRAAERAERTGAPALAKSSYVTAAELSAEIGLDDDQNAGRLWERAAEAASASGGQAAVIEYADRARNYYLQHGQTRAAARAQVLTGRGLRMSGRHSDAREQITASLEVLQADPDANTVLALEQLAMLEVFAGSPSADNLTNEALILGQALDVGLNQLIDLFTVRGIYLLAAMRRPEGIAYLSEAARLATQAGDNMRVGASLLNMADALAMTDPAAAVEAARTSAKHLRRAGERGFLAYTIGNLVRALLQLGEWHTAEQELTHAVESDGLGDIEYFTCYQGWLAALRGDYEAAEAVLAALRELRASEDSQDRAIVAVVEALAAAARLRPETVLRHAREVLVHADVLGMGHESPLWAWPLAARAAYDLGDTAGTGELLALLDSHPPGHLPPMLRAERNLVRARLADHDGDQGAAASFAAAIDGLRELSTPYHLAHGLLDQAQHLSRAGDAAAAAAAIDEARGIARQLGCQPLLDRADAMTPTTAQARV
jgi:predicted ATPase